MSQNHSEDPEDLDNRPQMEPLTDAEKEAFLSRARSEGRSLTSEEQYAIFGPPPEPEAPVEAYTDVEEMAPAELPLEQIDSLQENFFPQLEAPIKDPALISGIIFDFDDTLARLTRPWETLMEEGARSAEAYMRSTGMELPDDFYLKIMDARRFAHEKSEEEREEHIADDAMSFLLQFFGYPASKMDPVVLKRAVDIFYAPEMTAWELLPGVKEMLQELHTSGYKLAIVANYNCERVFQRSIDYLGIRPYLDATISSASVEFRKPDENLFNLILERWDALPYEIIVVGDSLAHDIQGGIDLGALTVLAQFGATAQVAFDNAALAEVVRPDAVISEWRQFTAHVNKWTAA